GGPGVLEPGKSRLLAIELGQHVNLRFVYIRPTAQEGSLVLVREVATAQTLQDIDRFLVVDARAVQTPFPLEHVPESQITRPENVVSAQLAREVGRNGKFP